MQNWKRPSESLPECVCGDRVVGIVRYSDPYNRDFIMRAHVIVFQATETGWTDTEGAGFVIEDCDFWILEKDLIEIALGSCPFLREVVTNRLGAVTALSREAYKNELHTIAYICRRTCDDDFKREVIEILNSLPCPSE